MSWNSELEAAFDPKAIAVVGASLKEDSLIEVDFVKAHQVLGYQGHIYPVNRKATETSEIDGLKVYPNLSSIPEHIDLVIVSVPRAAVPGVLEECATVGAKNVHIFTSGFKETGEPEGIDLENRIVEIAQRGGLHVLGPNCMGVFCPAAKIGTFAESASAKPGPVAFTSQSGGNMGEFTGQAEEYGIGFSKCFSYGNAAVVDSTDFLEYLATDPETKIITMYIEGVKDGKKLTEQVTEINKTKPVIIYKGGLTESGSRAASSHTGALSGQAAVWETFFKQTGAVSVDSLDELRDVTMTFLYCPPPKGRRIALIGAGGGNSVAGADVCAREGLQLPKILPKTKELLMSFVPLEGTSIGNPFDIGVALRDASFLDRALEPLGADPNIDCLMYDFAVGMLVLDYGSAREEMINHVVDFAKNNPYGVTLLMIVHRWMGGMDSTNEQAALRSQFLNAGVPAYHTLQRAARAYSKFVSYHEFHRKRRQV
jgi:acyl-CoA synthetase (NDP forming)